MAIRLLLADDQTLFVRCLKYVLETSSDEVEVVGVATNGLEAVRMAGELDPDLVLMDVRMPSMDGVEATRILHARNPSLKIVMLTTFQDDEYVHAAVRYGAAGYLLKNIAPENLIASIRAVMAGSSLFSREVTPSATGGETPASEYSRIIDSLSSRELEVLSLIMQTLNNTQIAQQMGIGQQSVRNYVHQLYAKFEIYDRFELIQAIRGVWQYHA